FMLRPLPTSTRFPYTTLFRSVIQSMARKLGIGEQSGIDEPSEITGLVPTRAWRAKVAAQELACERRRHVQSCGISDGRPWSVGEDRKSTRLNSSHVSISYAVF